MKASNWFGWVGCSSSLFERKKWTAAQLFEEEKRRREIAAFIDFFNSFINQLRLEAFRCPFTAFIPLGPIPQSPSIHVLFHLISLIQSNSTNPFKLMGLLHSLCFSLLNWNWELVLLFVFPLRSTAAAAAPNPQTIQTTQLSSSNSTPAFNKRKQVFF